MTVNFTTTSSTFDVIINGNNYGTWTRLDEIDSEFDLKVRDSSFILGLRDPYLSMIVNSTDTIQKNGVALTGTLRQKFASLKDEVFYLPAAAGGGSTYLVYTALLTQTGTSAPVATVKENTLGGTVVWGRYGVGEYYAELTGAFPLGKTFILPGFPIYIFGGGSFLVIKYHEILRSDNNSVNLSMYSARADTGSITLIENFNNIPVEIRVYP